MPGRFSLGHGLVLALGLHVAFFVFAKDVRPARARLEMTPVLATIDVEVPTLPPPLPEAPLTPTEPSAALAPAALPTVVGRRPTESTPSTSALVMPDSTPDTHEAWTIRVTTGPAPAASAAPLAALGLDGHNGFMGKRETPEEEARAAHEQANAAAGAAMRGALHDRDVSLGLGGGGPVVAALEAAVRASVAPDESHATLVAVADASGVVIRVEVESATDNSSYHAVAEDLLERLRSHPVRIPAGARGLAMRIDVTSVLARPSGGSVGLDPTKAGMHFDMSDIGERPKRVIHARVLQEDLL